MQLLLHVIPLLQDTWEAVHFGDIFVTQSESPVLFSARLPTGLPSAVCSGGHVCYTEDLQVFTNLGAHSSCRYSMDNNALTESYMCAREAIPGDGVGKVTVSMVCGPTLMW